MSEVGAGPVEQGRSSRDRSCGSRPTGSRPGRSASGRCRRCWATRSWWSPRSWRGSSIPDVPGWVGLLVVALLGLLAVAHVVLMPRIRFRVHRWEVTDTAVHTRAGWLGPGEPDRADQPRADGRLAPGRPDAAVRARLDHRHHRVGRRTDHRRLPRPAASHARWWPGSPRSRPPPRATPRDPRPRRGLGAARPAQAAARPRQGGRPGDRARGGGAGRDQPERHPRSGRSSSRSWCSARSSSARCRGSPPTTGSPTRQIQVRSGVLNKTHVDRAARPGAQRRPRGLAAAPRPRPAEGAGRHRRRRRPDHPRRPRARRRPRTAYDAAAPSRGRRRPPPPAGRRRPAEPDAPPRSRRHRPPSLLARIDWSWLRFAPFSLTRLVLLAGAVGVRRAVRRRPADLEPGDRDLGLAVGHAVRGRRRRARARRRRRWPSGSSSRSPATSCSGGASGWCASTARSTSRQGCSPPARSPSRRRRCAASRWSSRC